MIFLADEIADVLNTTGLREKIVFEALETKKNHVEIASSIKSIYSIHSSFSRITRVLIGLNIECVSRGMCLIRAGRICSDGRRIISVVE